jgi:spore coat protein U-like protein
MNVVEVETNDRPEPVLRRSICRFRVDISRGYGVLLSFNLRLIVGASALVVLAAWAHTALAQTADLNVTAQIVENCTLNGGTIDFGTYSSTGGTATEGEGTFSYQCTSGTDIVLSLNQGIQPEGGRRAMANGGGGTLLYELYTDAGRLNVWGEGPEEGLVVTGTAASQQTVQVFGSIDAGQEEPAGTYNDTVQITLVIQ